MPRREKKRSTRGLTFGSISYGSKDSIVVARVPRGPIGSDAECGGFWEERRMVVSDWCALCQILYDGVGKEDWKSMYNALRVAAKKVGTRRSGELALP